MLAEGVVVLVDASENLFLYSIIYSKRPRIRRRGSASWGRVQTLRQQTPLQEQRLQEEEVRLGRLENGIRSLIKDGGNSAPGQ